MGGKNNWGVGNNQSSEGKRKEVVKPEKGKPAKKGGGNIQGGKQTGGGGRRGFYV